MQYVELLDNSASAIGGAFVVGRITNAPLANRSARLLNDEDFDIQGGTNESQKIGV